MNKVCVIFLISFVVLAFSYCSTSKLSYYVPPELSDEDKKELVSLIKKGSKNYQKYCSECHGSKYTSMDQGPQFTEEQIRTYSVFMKIRNETHSFTQRMSSEDLDTILIYLKYRNPKS